MKELPTFTTIQKFSGKIQTEPELDSNSSDISSDHEVSQRYNRPPKQKLQKHLTVQNPLSEVKKPGKNTLSTVTDENTKLKAQVKDLLDDVATLASHLETMDTQISDYKQREKRAEDRVIAMEDEIASLKEQIDFFRTDKHSLIEQISYFRSASEETNHLRNKEKQNTADLQACLQTQLYKIEELQNEHALKSKQTEELFDNVKSLENQLEVVLEENERIRYEQQKGQIEYRSQLNKLQKKLKTTTKESGKMKELNKELNEDIGNMHLQLRRKADEIDTVRTKLVDREKMIFKLERDINKHKKKGKDGKLKDTYKNVIKCKENAFEKLSQELATIKAKKSEINSDDFFDVMAIPTLEPKKPKSRKIESLFMSKKKNIYSSSKTINTKKKNAVAPQSIFKSE